MITGVSPQNAEKFHQVWKPNGVSVPLLDTHFQFAADFANFVLNNFIAAAHAAAAARANEGSIVLTGESV